MFSQEANIWQILGVWKLNIHPVQGGGNDEKSSDVIHINLIRPLVFVQPVAVDRAILFWLSYKNAWEYWTEQRLNLNKEVLAATEQVLEKVNRSYIFNTFYKPHWIGDRTKGQLKSEWIYEDIDFRT